MDSSSKKMYGMFEESQKLQGVILSLPVVSDNGFTSVFALEGSESHNLPQVLYD